MAVAAQPIPIRWLGARSRGADPDQLVGAQIAYAVAVSAAGPGQ